MKRFVPLAATLAILAAAPAFAAETTTTPSTGTGTTTEPTPAPAPSTTTPSTTEPGTGSSTMPDSTGTTTTPDTTTTTPGATTTPDSSTGVTTGSTATPTSLSMTQEQADAWVDKPVYSSDDKNVGEVAEIARSADGSVTELRADVGGFLGMGETRVRLQPEQFQLGADRIDLKLSSEQINTLPKIETP